VRRFTDLLLAAVAACCGLVATGLLVGLVAVIAARGAPAMDWSFFTEQVRLAGAAGGILWNLVGTLILLATACGFCTPPAVALALWERVWLRNERSRRWLRTALYAANGIPSILFGLCGYILFVQKLGWGKSWLAGGLVLGFMMLPTVTLAFVERLRAIPPKYPEAAAAIGLNRTQQVWAVLIPQARGGLITGTLLGLARAAGETAPILFTATIFAGATFPDGIRDSPVLSLPYHIFILAQDSFDPAVGTRVWGAALVLLALVFALSLVALPGRLRQHEESHD